MYYNSRHYICWFPIGKGNQHLSISTFPPLVTSLFPSLFSPLHSPPPLLLLFRCQDLILSFIYANTSYLVMSIIFTSPISNILLTHPATCCCSSLRPVLFLDPYLQSAARLSRFHLKLPQTEAFCNSAPHNPLLGQQWCQGFQD